MNPSTSSSSSSPMVATDQAKQVRGNKNVEATSGIAVGEKGKYQESGSIDLSGAKGVKTGGVDIGKLTQADVSGAQAQGNIVVNDTSTASKALDTTSALGATFADALKNLSAQNSAALAAASAQNTAALQQTQAAQLQAQDTASSKTADLLGQVLNQQGSSTGSILQTFSDKLSSLAESQQTGGASEQNKTILYIVLAVLGLLATVFIFKR